MYSTTGGVTGAAARRREAQSASAYGTISIVMDCLLFMSKDSGSPAPAGAALPDDGGNVLIVDDSLPLKIEWESDDVVRISGRLNTQIFKQEALVSGVRVAYTD